MGSTKRMRRLRRTPSLRRLANETALTPDDFILPMFAIDGKGRTEKIDAMPGVKRYSTDLLAKHCENLKSPAVLLFGVPDEKVKDETGSYSLRDDGIVPMAIRSIKKARPDLAVITDICLCGYTNHGHCGILAECGVVENDATVEILGKMAVAHAAAGADLVAPSAMMDRQVYHMRRALDENGFFMTGIMSYAAKFASAFYGPFREAAASSPQFDDRSSYQLPQANRNEAVRDALLDETEGADWLMVKPAMPYLDVLHELASRTDLPVAAYQVSGEYAMIKSAAEMGRLDEKRAFMESLISIKRAGASAILTYWAEEACRELANE